MARGLIVSIESIDGAGKNTQSELLKKYYTDKRVKCEVFHFPFYIENFFGGEVRKYLNGEYGRKEDIHYKFAAMLYACDRAEAGSLIRRHIEEGYIIIFDRYVSSNVAYHSAKLPKEEREEAMKWMEDMEYDAFKLPKPNLTLFLNIHPSLSDKLVEKRGQKKDIHEEDREFMNEVYGVYKILSGRPDWKTVKCYNGFNILSVGEIQDKCIQIVEDHISTNGVLLNYDFLIESKCHICGFSGKVVLMIGENNVKCGRCGYEEIVLISQ